MGASVLPREVVLELTVRRASKPIYSPLSTVKIDRADLSLDAARAVFEELSAADDAANCFRRYRRSAPASGFRGDG